MVPAVEEQLGVVLAVTATERAALTDPTEEADVAAADREPLPVSSVNRTELYTQAAEAHMPIARQAVLAAEEMATQAAPVVPEPRTQEEAAAVADVLPPEIIQIRLIITPAEKAALV